MLAQKLLSAMAGGEEKLYVDDVFSTYLYTGNSSTQTINNGIDLAGKGGMIWGKSRSATFGHEVVDTVRGVGKRLNTSTADAQAGISDVTAFNGNGFTLGYSSSWLNESPKTQVAWTFRKAPKFFDVVTYTGNGVAGRQIPHDLGIAPGMIFVKCTSNATDWTVFHRGLTEGSILFLNETGAQTASSDFGGVGNGPSSAHFTIGAGGRVNQASDTYVAYIFAHDDSADGIIQCGSFTQSSAVDVAVNVMWEPQFLIVKRVDSVGGWMIFDDLRGFLAWASGVTSQRVFANTSDAESGQFYGKTASGFVHPSNYYASGTQTYIYLAIRRPNKPPTTGTEVYNAIARTGTGVAATVTGVGFAPDLVMTKGRTGTRDNLAFDRLRGKNMRLVQNATGAEYSLAVIGATFEILQDGLYLNGNDAFNGNNSPYINHFFRRAPGVFDVVCDTGTGAAHAVPHSLSVAPELIIRKKRTNIDANQGWVVYNATLGNNAALFLQTTDAAFAASGIWNLTNPTSTSFTVGSNPFGNSSGDTFVSYLFATLPGISKVGSYTGNGSSQTINCGFTTGARFILIKRTDSTGDWYVWDSVRGIISANDPHLSLNATVAEVTTDDSVDPDSNGFIVNQVAATNINVSGGTYIFLAIA